MEIEKMRLLVCESVYWVNINADMEHVVKQCATCLDYQQTQPHEKNSANWEVVDADILSIHNNMLFCIVDYYSKFPSWRKLMACQLITQLKQLRLCLQNLNYQRRVSDVGMNFVSDWFEQFCRQLNIDQAITSSYHHQSIGKVEACVVCEACHKNALITIMTSFSLCSR